MFARAAAARRSSLSPAATPKQASHISTSARSDRKSTRLNSSHDQISYAVFCLKKKKENNRRLTLWALNDIKTSQGQEQHHIIRRMTPMHETNLPPPPTAKQTLTPASEHCDSKH